MPNRVSSRSRWRRSNGRGWLVRVPPGAGGTPCAADGEEPQPEARQRRTAAKKGRQSGPSLKESLRNGRSGEIRTHDPQHPMLMRYQAALRSDRGGTYRTENHNPASLRFSYRKAGATGSSRRRGCAGLGLELWRRSRRNLPSKLCLNYCAAQRIYCKPAAWRCGDGCSIGAGEPGNIAGQGEPDDAVISGGAPDGRAPPVG